MKKYKVITDKFFKMKINDLGTVSNGEYTRMMVFKKFLWWYFPLTVKQFISSEYDRALDKTVYHMDTNEVKDVPKFFKDGRIRLRSLTGDKPFWYFYSEDRGYIETKYFNDIEDYMNENAEKFI